MSEKKMTHTHRAEKMVQTMLLGVGGGKSYCEYFLSQLEAVAQESEAEISRLKGELEKIHKVGLDRELGQVVGSEHYEKAWLDCVELAGRALAAYPAPEPMNVCGLCYGVVCKCLGKPASAVEEKIKEILKNKYEGFNWGAREGDLRALVALAREGK